ncbi:GPI-anchor transamidase subunit GAA1 SCDLUD_001697 [Saccharomycodes ludwigii]|uniref:GPI-anchor transamidase subunit GAA1 n=1 Tax=Saccharomycodes ludwigii TaxID=36035 RepID=UPI001E89A931|nr:hypothetical protein SCDLUD_001697 [Saccharomycodes ludwigii]KAH3901913.1 hypothetical protein SCDLUD_001697 [Saccharomycodes ludwigii]
MSLLEKLHRRAANSGLITKAITSLPKLSKLFTIVGILWLCVYLPAEGNFRNTYFSENALMPNQAYSYFRETEWNIVRGYRSEITKIINDTDIRNTVVSDWLNDIVGVKTAIHHNSRYGDTLYGILNAQRGDGTEAMVLAAPWQNSEGDLNTSGVSVAIALLRFFSRWPVWSKNIILVLSDNSNVALRNWVEAYHTSLDLTGGSIEASIVLDYPGTSDYIDFIELYYTGLNGDLPNLDLVNVAVSVIEHEGLKVSLNGIKNFQARDFQARLETLLLGVEKMALAGVGEPIMGHECFSGWRIQSVTVKAKGDKGPADVTTFGRIVEASFRSVNNLLEKFHQSFFFYILLAPKWFISIASYLPAAIFISISYALASLNAIVNNEFSSLPMSSTHNIQALLLLGCCLIFTFVLSRGFSLVICNRGNEHTYNVLMTSVLLGSQLFLSNLKSLTKLIIKPELGYRLKCFAYLFFSVVLTSLLVLNFSLSYVISILAFPMTLLVSSNSILKNKVFLIISNPFISTFIATSLIKNTLQWNIFCQLVEAWKDLGCFTWFVICIGWYTPWLMVALSDCNETLNKIEHKSNINKQE